MKGVLLYGANGSPLLSADSVHDAMEQAPTNVLSVAAYLLGRNPDTGQAQRVSVRDADTDAQNANHKYLKVASANHAFGATYWERWRNNVQGTLLASAQRNADTDTATMTNYNAKGVMLFLRISATSGTGGLKPILILDGPVEGSIWYLTAGSAQTATALYVYTIYPGVTSGGTERFSAPLPRTWKVRIQHQDASNYTYSLGYSYIV